MSMQNLKKKDNSLKNRQIEKFLNVWPLFFMLSNVIYNVKICVHMENGFYLMFLLFKPDQLQSVFKYIYYFTVCIKRIFLIS